MKLAPWAPDQFEFQQDYAGGQQAYEQKQNETLQNWQNQQLGLGANPPKSNAQVNPFGSLGGGGTKLGGGGTKNLFSQFDETLGGYGEQLGGFGEQLGGFGEQIGGFKGQFENIDNRLQNMEQGITSLTDKLGTQPQQQQQQQQNPFSTMFSNYYNPYGGGYGGYGNYGGGFQFYQDGGEVQNPEVKQGSITNAIDKIKNFFQQRKESQPKVEDGGSEYNRIFDFLWKQGYSQPQIDAIIRGEINQEDIAPERMQLDENMNSFVPDETFKGAGGGIASIRDFTAGGGVNGPGTETSDSIPAMLSDGEFVMTADAVKGFGGGNREQGAQKLYSMMRNAESGAKNTRRS